MRGAKGSPAARTLPVPSLGNEGTGPECCSTNDTEAPNGLPRTLRSDIQTSQRNPPAVSGRPGRRSQPVSPASSSLASSACRIEVAPAERWLHAPESREILIARRRPTIPFDAIAFPVIGEGCSPPVSGTGAVGELLPGETGPEGRSDRFLAQSNSTLAGPHGRIASELHTHSAIHGHGDPASMPARSTRRGSMG